MSKFLADVLANDHPLFTFNMSRLEKAARSDTVDIKIAADCRENAHAVMRQLGLDPADTQARELYGTLNSLSRDESRLKELLGATHYVLLPFDEGPVSFNIQDVIENGHHGLAFEQRICGHAQRHLRLEIVRRYAELDHTDNTLVQRLAQEIGLVQHGDQEHPELIIEPTGKDDPQVDNNTPYILSAGDIFTDAFIKLNEEVARVDTDPDGSKRLSLPLGTKPPYDQVDIVKAVGPAPNAAVAFARLGLRSGLDAFIGDDETGQEALEYLQQQNVMTDTMLVEQGLKTNYYFVLRYGAERTILVKNEQYDYKWEAPQQTPDWVYLALMSDASWSYHEDLLRYLEENPDVKLAFQPGTFHFEWGPEKLAGIYRRSHILILNREEAVDVTGRSYDSIRDLAEGLHELGPEKVVITDGPNGSYASYDGKLVTIPNYPDPGPPLDRTGAGDAFASTIVAALAQGESMDTALTWAPINSMNVVQNLGAQAGLLGKADVEKYLAEAPTDYKVTELS